MKALLFPGQGSQSVGMGLDHYKNKPKFRSIVGEADELLGYPLSEIMFEGPSDELTQTKYTQPAIFVHSYALFQILNIEPDVVAGHSLGEFSALAAAGAIDFNDALELVSLRGNKMQVAGNDNPGTMAAIIGMDDETVDEICDEATSEIGKPVVPANYNCPGQLVISGDVDAVHKAIDLAKEKGCRLAKILPVSGAFHSPLMKPAFEALQAKLENTKFMRPHCKVYSNYTAEASRDETVLKENVLQQLVNPVKWTQTLLNMERYGIDTFIEVGPGNVLQGLVKRTLKNVTIEGYE
ncbi:ACP S-malonyltransferase [Rhodohalobacter sp. 614A]|uniref:ACP S-malonyltransferase n=1 Tax=Rhodohalobacter sp. 614A TaxID=2908649 RepID=UPI001F34E1A3|nr:ACP S-malonyltransferase [Rhodohalobacter sp. 614A]